MEFVYGLNRWHECDVPISVGHGGHYVLFRETKELRDHYQGKDVFYEFYQLDEAGQGAWNRNYEVKSLGELSFDFITMILDLNVEAN